MGVLNMNNKERQRCIEFLKQNGWKLVSPQYENDDYDSYFKEDSIGVEINDHEMVFIDEFGDFLHSTINYYTLVGVMIECRQVGWNYTSISTKEIKIKET